MSDKVQSRSSAIREEKESELKKQDHKTATYTRTLTKQDGFIPFSTLTKALNNQPLTFEELPEIIKNMH